MRSAINYYTYTTDGQLKWQERDGIIGSRVHWSQRPDIVRLFIPFAVRKFFFVTTEVTDQQVPDGLFSSSQILAMHHLHVQKKNSRQTKERKESRSSWPSMAASLVSRVGSTVFKVGRAPWAAVLLPRDTPKKRICFFLKKTKTMKMRNWVWWGSASSINRTAGPVPPPHTYWIVVVSCPPLNRIMYKLLVSKNFRRFPYTSH